MKLFLRGLEDIAIFLQNFPLLLNSAARISKTNSCFPNDVKKSLTVNLCVNVLSSITQISSVEKCSSQELTSKKPSNSFCTFALCSTHN